MTYGVEREIYWGVWEAAGSGYYHDTLNTCIKFSKNQ